MEVNGQLHASAAIPWVIVPGTHCIGSRVGPKIRSGRYGVEKKNSCSCKEWKPGRLTHSPSAYGLNYPGSIETNNSLRVFRRLFRMLQFSCSLA
jgi:hypothetical protein